ncbi:hypothetical protein GBA52_024356 [Prunus armeniaca]|nr:hypothetical protein GBA52_024356 [Prunus armeniaca]
MWLLLNSGQLYGLLSLQISKTVLTPTIFEDMAAAVMLQIQPLILLEKVWLCLLKSTLEKDKIILEVGPENASQGLMVPWKKTLYRLCEAADEAVQNGCQLLVLSDRSDELEATRPAIPILLAVGAVHQHLIQNGLRMSASIIVDTAQCFSTHQFACLIGYGASAVCPYLALETCRQWRLSTKTEVVDLAFCGSISSVGGLTFDEETLSFWVKAFSEDTAKRLENFGFIQFRPGGSYSLRNNLQMSLMGTLRPFTISKVFKIGDNATSCHQAGGFRTFWCHSNLPWSLPISLEIKIAQGAKAWGKVANCLVNPKAKVSVKLVAEAGIGTVASGVAKGNADIIQISGHDGGTGASPISSIKHAGGPWELGLTETHQTLLSNGLRERVILRVDGGFKSGVDVLMAAAMGADEYGFGSVAMIATGCVMARICHTNNCPVGVASQREELRARFPGVPGDLVNFFLYVAEEVRGMLAQLGYEKLDDIIGRTNLLRPRDISLVKTQHLDLSYLLSNVGLPKWSSTMIRNQDVHTNGPVLDDILLADPEISDAIENEKVVYKTIKIYNVDRAVCGRIAGVVAKKYGDTGFAGQLNITFTGSAGQSFGCFLTPGMNIRLVGEANDYVGKSISGGELVVTPVENTGFCPEDATIVGNTCLYGATGGQIFIRGKAGERFAVRNSLAQAVVEGTGDHCCEYMTGGCVVVLGKVGRNVAAGMTGGLAYILDEDNTFIPKVNREIVKIQRVNAPVGQMQLKSLIEAHVEKTGSGKGSAILKEWDKYLPLFYQLVPPSEEDTPEACADYEQTAAVDVTLQSTA